MNEQSIDLNAGRMNNNMRIVGVKKLNNHKKVNSVKELSFVEKVKMATHKNKRVAFILGAIAGGFVPVASYCIAHLQIPQAEGFISFVSWLMVIGGLIYSALSVYDFGKQAFGSSAKAVGFVMITELVLVFGQLEWLCYGALAILVGINSVIAGVNLAMEKVSSVE